MKNYVIGAIIAVATLFAACDNTPKFVVEGNITDADSLTLYLENITMAMPAVVDSVILKADGRYKFEDEVATHAQFYRLRLGSQSINLVADSAISIRCNSNAMRFATDYTIEGSADCATMREVTLSGARLKKIVSEAMDNHASRLMALDSINAYKARMTELILQAPSSPVAYYILMQRVNGLPIFDTYDYNDNRIIAAAATAHETYCPDAPRTQVIVDVALQGMAARYQEQNSVTVEAEPVNYVDISLYDITGNARTLSELATTNRVVLLDFTAYALEYSPAYNMQLAEIYKQYSQRGLEIYQVSFDTDLNRWQTVADNLPWTCVHEADNVYSNLISLYDIISLPSCFIIVENGEQLIRPADVEDMKQQVAKLLN